MLEEKWTHEYGDDHSLYFYRRRNNGTWVRGTQSRFGGETCISSPFDPPERLKELALQQPSHFPNFRIIREGRELSYTEADVDRLVELQWATMRTDKNGFTWGFAGKIMKDRWLESAQGNARAFLTDYAAFKAKK